MSNYQAIKSEASQIGSKMFQKAEGINIMSLLKVFAVIMIIILAVIFGKKVIDWVKGLFPTPNPIKDSYNNETSVSNLWNASPSGSPSSGANVPTGGSNDAPKPWRGVVDQIYDKLKGNNMFEYPAIVNKIAHMSDEYARKAAYYWDATYKMGEGCGLYGFIQNEWFDDGYSPALGKLKKLGFKY